ncbi:hypothetical protein EA772_14115 [Pedobacter sp. G11]|uniref:hypothetical protein n=1 Tax=Pedobacter sp. G11 TaxID=2482728 RepID=UPI000F5D6E27|nr:hypothetical protein [Pedobacter sp. G11]AZI26414.1 hypothetical protein EA772_14115 [Pedobacter sp. G11]
MELKKIHILIVGGYGLVGSNIARLLRAHYPYIELILAGRNPENGEQLAKELNNAKTVLLDLDKGFNLSNYAPVDLIITAMEDHSNILRETAISHGIACITVSEVADQIAPTAFLSLHQKITAPVVFAGHWQAGILTLVTKQLATRFKDIARVTTAGIYDERDPIGPLLESQVDNFVDKALMRKAGNWMFVKAKDNGRAIELFDRTLVTGYPMSTLDVPSIAAFTDASDIRFDFATGKSVGTAKGMEASHDMYIEIEGVLLSGEEKKLRTLVSGPKGNAHLTGVGVFLIADAILGAGGQSAPLNGGLYLPETIIKTENIIKRLTEFGIHINEDIG